MLKRRYRFIYMILVGISFVLIAEVFKRDQQDSHNILLKLIFGSIISCIIWEGNLRIDQWLNGKYPWLLKPQTRLVFQLLISSLYTVISLKGLLVVTQIIQSRQSLLHHPPPPHDPLFIPALLLVFIILLIDTCLNFFSAWKQSILDVERFKAQVTEAQLHALKNQLNPHFLFNNLSVLSSLVYQNQDKAVSFISELAKVYRYVLENNKKELVLLEEELAFISHYVFLLKIRFANSFNCRIHVDENLLSRYIPPMSLQVLVENAIQHNESSISKPLTVNIYSRGNSLTIENNIQPRIEIQETTKFGLMNIQSRYFYTTEEKIQVLHDQYVHKVILPLIVKK